MALSKQINDFKTVFSGANAIYLKKGGFPAGTLTNLDFDWEIPVTVDSMTLSQSEPTINKVMVHGLQTPWVSISTPGEFSFKATVPSIDEDFADWALGGSTGALTAIPLNGSATDVFDGKSYAMEAIKLYASIGIRSEDKNKLLVIKKMAIYATPTMDNLSQSPYAFTLTGTIEASDDTNRDDIIIFQK